MHDDGLSGADRFIDMKAAKLFHFCATCCEADFVRPVQSLIPGVQGRVLAVRTTAELNLGTVARLAGVSPAHAPASLVLFGSLARGEGDSESDIDVLVVRRADVDGDDEHWNESLDDWLLDARRVAGTP